MGYPALPNCSAPQETGPSWSKTTPGSSHRQPNSQYPQTERRCRPLQLRGSWCCPPRRARRTGMRSHPPCEGRDTSSYPSLVNAVRPRPWVAGWHSVAAWMSRWRPRPAAWFWTDSRIQYRRILCSAAILRRILLYRTRMPMPHTQKRGKKSSNFHASWFESTGYIFRHNFRGFSEAKRHFTWVNLRQRSR